MLRIIPAQFDRIRHVTIVTRTLSARLVDLNAEAYDDGQAALHVSIIVPDSGPVPVATDDPTALITGTQKARFVNGEATLELIPNSRITPADTRYQATLTANPQASTIKFVMPDRDANLADLTPRPVQGRALRLSTGGVLLLNDGSRLLL